MQKMLHVRVFKALIAIFIIALWTLAAHAQDLQPVPPLTGRVIDTTGTLDATQTAALDAKLAALERDKGAQVVVLMVPTTAPEDIAGYANRVGNSWKIGRAGVGDGLILLIALKDRRARLEVAKTLEGAVPDIAARHIIDEAIAPRFRAGDFAGGVAAGVDQIAARIRGEPLLPVAAPKPGAGAAALGLPGFSPVELLIVLFLVVPIVNSLARGLLGRKLGALATGAGVGALAFVVTASVVLAVIAGMLSLIYALVRGVTSGLPQARRHGRSGGWGFPTSGGWGGGGGFGSGGGGGGFSSGGGGDFGGGGASGSW